MRVLRRARLREYFCGGSLPRALIGAMLALVLSSFAHGQVNAFFQPDDYEVEEEAGNIEITIRLTSQPGGPEGSVHTVTLNTVAGTAQPVLDYTELVNNIVQFGPAEFEKKVQIPIIGDGANTGIYEPLERFTVQISNGTGNIVVSPDPVEARVTIIDDDPPPGCVEDFATFDVGIEITRFDDHALLPLNDWTPLFYVDMQGDLNEETGAFPDRVLSYLQFEITDDLKPFSERNHDKLGTPPRKTDLLEFAIFHEVPDDADDDTVELDVDDEFITTFDVNGNPYGTAIVDDFGEIIYTLDLRPAFLFTTFGYSGGYIIAVRTSPLWRNDQSMSTIVWDGHMLKLDGTEPVPCEIGQDGDSYSIFEDGPVLEEVGYSASFTAWDTTGSELNPLFQAHETNEWKWPNKIYTPLNDHARFRFDVPGQFFDLALGEFVDMRIAKALESWIPVIGINIHGGATPFVEFPANANFLGAESALREVNVILTDVGGDPFGPAGNGGLDPRQGLDSFTDSSTGVVNPAFGKDFAFNSVWVYHDTNNNGAFDAPTVTADSGISFTDYPMYPEFGFISGLNDAFEPGWEYIPFPPGGGDPWWKIRLRLDFGRRRAVDETPTGFLEPIPDLYEITSDGEATLGNSSRIPDYYVVVHPDSGFKDASLLQGDGTAFRMGADFRAFIEPRRFNPVIGSVDGGIICDTQAVFVGDVQEPGVVFRPWQDSPLWDAYHPEEPWWPQRTLNASVAKPVRVGLEVRDLTMTYSTTADLAGITNINYYSGSVIFDGDGTALFGTTNFDSWMDPFGLIQNEFFDFHSVGTYTREYTTIVGLPGISVAIEDIDQPNQYSYETVPFENRIFDFPPFGPRSEYYAPPFMRPQPTLPDFSTWLPSQTPPSSLPQGQYPREIDWKPENRKARLLQQRIDTLNRVALLGFNLVGADDPAVNRVSPMSLQEVNVAFWGPSFTPDDLLTLDANGEDDESGVILYEDTDTNGVYLDVLGADELVPLVGLSWKAQPERIDLDGDGLPDDLNGDSILDSKDKAWVLTLKPRGGWTLPQTDERTGDAITTPTTPPAEGKSLTKEVVSEAGAEAIIVKQDSSELAGKTEGNVVRIDVAKAQAMAQAQASNAKALPLGGNIGDDLFLVVNTSPNLTRFDEFRVLIPATLPDRANVLKQAGIKFFPTLIASPQAYAKMQPEEGPVQEFYGTKYTPKTIRADGSVKQTFYGHDLLQANVPVVLTDLTEADQEINPESETLAVVGIDIATNRAEAEGTFDTGLDGTPGERLFSVAGETWPKDGLIGYWLVDSNYESFEIIDNEPTTLVLRSGTPKKGPWRIAKDPTFLEQLVIELYNNGADHDFDINTDLLPLDKDQTISGLAIYRDNDFGTNNRNGRFDEDIDIPLTLDYEPFRIGVPGEPDTQIKFVFSSPGTDDVATQGSSPGLANQPRRRQWVPDTFQSSVPGVFSGPEFFVVIRTSEDVDDGDDFSLGVVSWGPATPTEPDPDTFPPGLTPQDEFDIFSEFPWGNRALGFITYFKDAPDLTGFKWIRTHSSKQLQTNVITVVPPEVDPNAVVIISATPTTLNRTIGPDGLAITIIGDNFGLTPNVTIEEDVPCAVLSATDTKIVAVIPPGTNLTVPVLLTVQNPLTQSQATRGDIFSLTDDAPPVTPQITSITPGSGNEDAFPVTIEGVRFDTPAVYFGGTEVTVVSSTPSQIVVGFPTNGLQTSGPQDVVVVNRTGAYDLVDNGFSFVNPGAVTILSVSPTVLQSVTPVGGWAIFITGTNFGLTPTVTLDGTSLSIFSVSATEIVAIIPGGTVLTTPVNLTVTNPTTGSIATRDDLFTLEFKGESGAAPLKVVPPSPEILLVVPDRGDVDSFPIIIQGLNFESPRVFFQGVEMPVVTSSASSITIGFPEVGLPTTGFLDITVINQTTGAFVSKNDGFFFENPGAVSITRVTPSVLQATTPATGAAIAIVGTNFGSRPTATLEGVGLTILTVTDTEIVALIPGGAILRPPVVLTVRNPINDTFSTRDDVITVTELQPPPIPTITAVDPNIGDTTVFPVQVLGTNFSNPRVFFQGVEMPVVTFTANQIVVGLPDAGLSTGGALDVAVINSLSGAFALSPNAFTFVNNVAVSINSVLPTTLPSTIPARGMAIVIDGANFGAAPTLLLDNTPLEVFSAGDTEIVAAIPGDTILTAPVVLRVENTVTNTFTVRDDLFTLTVDAPPAAPTFTTIIPNRGDSAAFPVAIFGGNFVTPRVFFEDREMPIVASTATLMTVGFPAQGIPTSGFVDVTVLNESTGSFSTFQNVFFFENPQAIQIIKATPTVLPATTPAAGTAIILEGLNFGVAPTATLNGQSLTILSASDTQIVARIEGGTLLTSPLELIVANPINGTRTTRTDLFTLSFGGAPTPPTINEVVPGQGNSSVFPVQVNGANFVSPRVFFQGAEMPVQSSTATTIVVGFPAGGLPQAGLLDVTVINGATGTIATKQDAFLFEDINAVTITGATPSILRAIIPAAGAVVLITGTNFGNAPTATIDGVPLLTVSVSDTFIGAIIPGGTALTAPVDLTVRNTDRQTQASRSDLFSLTTAAAPVPPTVTAVVPVQADSNAFPVQVLGSSFSNPRVFFQETEMSVSSFSSGQVIVDLPLDGTLPSTGLLDVLVMDSATGAFGVLLDAFTFLNDEGVNITSATPDTLPATTPESGIGIIIAGTNFGANPVVSLGTTALDILASTDTEIVAIIPGGTVVEDPAALKVKNPANNTFARRDDLFTVSASASPTPPTFTQVIPERGDGTVFPVTVFGTGFDVPRVFFQDTSMPIASSTVSQIVLDFPAGGVPSAGLLDITIINSTTGAITTEPDAFLFENPNAVAITAVSPTVLQATTPEGGRGLIITGINFGGAPTATLDRTPLTILGASDTQIVALIPGGTILTVPVTLTVSNPINGTKATRDDLFTLTFGSTPPVPTITSVTPDRGDSTVFPVTIAGSNFSSPRVFFQGTEVPVLSATSTQIVVGFPENGLAAAGALDVTVINGTTGTLATLPGAFVFDNVNAITITGATPNELLGATPATGVAVFITGTNFGTAARVALDGTLLEVLVSTNTEIAALIPGGTTLAEPVDLVVRNTITGVQAIRSDLFTVVSGSLPPVPTILSVTPDAVDALLFPVEIVGTNFDNPRVFFQDTQMPILLSSETQIVVGLPAVGLRPPAGLLDVVVVNQSTGAFAVAPDALFYFDLNAVNILGVSPDESQPITSVGGTALFINGLGFGTTPQVTLDGTPLEVFLATDEEIIAVIPSATILSDPVLLTVFNPATQTHATDNDLITVATDVPAPGPSVNQLLPERGEAGDFPVTLYGNNFGTPRVFFGRSEMRVGLSTNTRAVLNLPLTGLPAGLLDVMVVNTTNGELATAIDAFLFIDPTAVEITSATPNLLESPIPIGGRVLIVTGSNFGETPEATLDGTELEVRFGSDTEIVALIPGGTTLDEPVELSVRNSETNSVASRDDLFVLNEGAAPAQPTIARVAPTSGDETAFPIRIDGTNFAIPRVYFGDTAMVVLSSTPTSIIVDLPEDGLTTEEALDVFVVNQTTGAFAMLEDAFSFRFRRPTVTSVDPDRGNSNDFPVFVFGSNFIAPRVFFDETELPVESFTATRIIVGFPPGDFPRTGPLDVRVLNEGGGDAVLPGAFTYESLPIPPVRPCFIATAAYGTPFTQHLDTFRGFRDGVLLKTAVGAALVDTYYTASPTIADAVAEHGWLAAFVRAFLTPVAIGIEHPMSALEGLALVLVALSAIRYRRTFARMRFEPKRARNRLF